MNTAPKHPHYSDVELKVEARQLTDNSTVYDLTLTQDGATLRFNLTAHNFMLLNASGIAFLETIKTYTLQNVTTGG